MTSPPGGAGRAASAPASIAPPGEPPTALSGFSGVNRYWDPMQSIWAAKLLPGEYYVTRHSEMIITVLGSCVACCARHKETGVAGMNHFMLPTQGRPDSATDGRKAVYGEHAMDMLIESILKHGGRRSELEIKVIGGGKIYPNMADVGALNAAFALDWLKKQGLSIAANDTGGPHARKVYFDVATGRVRVMKLGELKNDTILVRERQYGLLVPEGTSVKNVSGGSK